MGVPTSEVGYIPAMPRREAHEVHKGHVVALEKKIVNLSCLQLYQALNISACFNSILFNDYTSLAL